METSNAKPAEGSESTPSTSGDSTSAIKPPRNQRETYRHKAPVSNEGKAKANADADETPAARKLDLAELFADRAESETDDDADDPSKPVDSIDRLSKRLKMDMEKVYAIKVPVNEGEEPVTIGQLKDRVKAMDDLETRETQFEERRIQSEGELLKAQTFMRGILSKIPQQHLSKELVQQVESHHRTTMQRERELTLQHIPEWKTEKNEQDDRTKINAMLSNYGFGPEFLESITDHRAIKFVRDMAIRDARIKEALAKVQPDTRGNKRVSAKAPAPNRPKGSPVRQKGPAPDGLRAMFSSND